MVGLITLLDVVLGAYGLYILQHLLQRGDATPIPPGPKGYPLLGNILEMPKEKEWLTFAAWGRIWGDLLSVNILGRRMIIVNSASAMGEINRRSKIYSERPRWEMVGELAGFSRFLLLMPYGERVLECRKRLVRYFGLAGEAGCCGAATATATATGPGLSASYPAMENEARKFIKRMSISDDLLGNLRKLSSSILLRVTYGYTPIFKTSHPARSDPIVAQFDQGLANLTISSIAGSFFVDFFPSVREFAEWLPGMGFVRTSRTWLSQTMEMVEGPFAWAKKQAEMGECGEDSFVRRAMKDGEGTMDADDVRDLKYTAASIYHGGSDSNVASTYAFFLAMVLYPDVQKKAQQEIDSITGSHRLPSFSDRANMPYTNAIVTEVLRWHSVNPTGIPHILTEGDLILGMFVPGGSLVVANLWQMLHDPTTYPKPFTFDPTRHLGVKPQADPRTICFGFGNRACPGADLAQASLFITIATALSVFDVTNAVVNGKRVVPVHENMEGSTSYPGSFTCSIKPRSGKAELIR